MAGLGRLNSTRDDWDGNSSRSPQHKDRTTVMSVADFLGDWYADVVRHLGGFADYDAASPADVRAAFKEVVRESGDLCALVMGMIGEGRRASKTFSKDGVRPYDDESLFHPRYIRAADLDGLIARFHEVGPHELTVRADLKADAFRRVLVAVQDKSKLDGKRDAVNRRYKDKGDSDDGSAKQPDLEPSEDRRWVMVDLDGLHIQTLVSAARKLGLDVHPVAARLSAAEDAPDDVFDTIVRQALIDNTDGFADWAVRTAIRVILPEEFHEARCGAEWSSSAFQPSKPPGELRLHAFFETDVGFDDAQMREVFKAAKVRIEEELGIPGAVLDDRLLISNQVHYISPPAYRDGTDPLHGKARAWIVEGTEAKVPVSKMDLAVVAERARAIVSRFDASKLAGVSASGHFDAFRQFLERLAASTDRTDAAARRGLALMAGGRTPEQIVTDARKAADEIGANGADQKWRFRGDPLAEFLGRLGTLGRGETGQGFQGVIPGAVQKLANRLGAVAPEGGEVAFVAWMTLAATRWAAEEAPHFRPQGVDDYQFHRLVQGTRSADRKYDAEYVNDIVVRTFPGKVVRSPELTLVKDREVSPFKYVLREHSAHRQQSVLTDFVARDANHVRNGIYSLKTKGVEAVVLSDGRGRPAILLAKAAGGQPLIAFPGAAKLGDMYGAGREAVRAELSRVLADLAETCRATMPAVDGGFDVPGVEGLRLSFGKGGLDTITFAGRSFALRSAQPAVEASIPSAAAEQEVAPRADASARVFDPFADFAPRPAATADRGNQSTAPAETPAPEIPEFDPFDCGPFLSIRRDSQNPERDSKNLTDAGVPPRDRGQGQRDSDDDPFDFPPPRRGGALRAIAEAVSDGAARPARECSAGRGGGVSLV